jgi:hypothetical protein
MAPTYIVPPMHHVGQIDLTAKQHNESRGVVQARGLIRQVNLSTVD